MTRKEYDKFLSAINEIKEKRFNLFTTEIHASKLYQNLSNRIGNFSKEEKQFIKCSENFDSLFNLYNREVFDDELFFMSKAEYDGVIVQLEKLLSKISDFVKKFNWC